jgi:NADH-quinone oxidoreductase subunit F
MEFNALRAAARRRWNRRHRGKLRVAVQVAHCSQAAGAVEVAQALREALGRHGLNAEVVETGCDGACYLAPRVSILEDATFERTANRGDAVWLSRVTPRRAEAIMETLATTRLPPSDPEPEVFFGPQTRRITANFGITDPSDIDDYILRGGYAGLCNALAVTPEQVIQTVLDSGLQGRGGAYFPAALKWRAARAHANVQRYLVLNAEEGEPGVFKDRHIMEAEPHRVLEGAAIAACAAGAERIFLYINAEAELSAQRMETALAQAYKLGVFGDDALGSGVRIQAEVRRGAGGYVCGDETTLLNTIEGQRRVPRLRPPFPTDAGLWGLPTVINNTETLSNVPWVMANGAQAYASVGLAPQPNAPQTAARGTKLICLSGAVQRPGLAEVPMGTTIRAVVEGIGGGPLPGHRITALAVGGPSSGVLPPNLMDTPLRPGNLHPSGVVMGAGGVIVLDERTPVLDAVRRMALYNADESCGKCTPCREGTPKMAAILDRIAAARGPAAGPDLAELRELAEVIGAASLCGLGQMSGNPVNSWLQLFAGNRV